MRNYCFCLALVAIRFLFNSKIASRNGQHWTLQMAIGFGAFEKCDFLLCAQNQNLFQVLIGHLCFAFLLVFWIYVNINFPTCVCCCCSRSLFFAKQHTHSSSCSWLLVSFHFICVIYFFVSVTTSMCGMLILVEAESEFSKK